MLLKQFHQPDGHQSRWGLVSSKEPVMKKIIVIAIAAIAFVATAAFSGSDKSLEQSQAASLSRLAAAEAAAK